jgi:hypothetical protein
MKQQKAQSLTHILKRTTYCNFIKLTALASTAISETVDKFVGICGDEILGSKLTEQFMTVCILPR